MTDLVVADTLHKRFGPVVAVDGISLAVPRGEVLGFLGPNAAGKSTTMKMLTGYLLPDSGRVTVAGHDMARDALAGQRQLGYLPEGAPLYGDMTTDAFLDFVARARGYRGREKTRRIATVVERVALESVLHRPVEALSKGFKRRVALAQAILHDPPVLILDEPTDGLDPNQKQHVRRLIRDMAADKAIIISTHILEEVEAVCSRAAIIADGVLRADGTPDALLARAPDHGVVTLTLAGDAGEARAALSDLDGVAGIEAAPARDGRAALRVVPEGGRAIAPAVGGRLRDRGIAVDEMVVERGSLDAVFRDVTGVEGGRDGGATTDGTGAAA